MVGGKGDKGGGTGLVARSPPQGRAASVKVLSVFRRVWTLQNAGDGRGSVSLGVADARAVKKEHFVSTANGCRSLMAMFLFNALAGEREGGGARRRTRYAGRP